MLELSGRDPNGKFTARWAVCKTDRFHVQKQPCVPRRLLEALAWSFSYATFLRITVPLSAPVPQGKKPPAPSTNARRVPLAKQTGSV